VTLRADEAVSSRHPGLLRVDVHLLKIQNGKGLHHGQAAADVPDAEMPDAGHDITADILADFLQIVVQFAFLLF
jgi:hypothetical protein